MSRSSMLEAGVVSVEPEELKVRVKAGTNMAELAEVLAGHGQRLRLPMVGSVGGAVASRRNGPFPADNRGFPNIVLMVHAIDGLGRKFRAGGATVKNVSGFDLVKVLVGSRGMLATITEVLLRTEPVPLCSRWFVGEGSTLRLHRPTLVTNSETGTLVNLEGHPDDVDEQYALLEGFTEVSRPSDAELAMMSPPIDPLEPDDAQIDISRRLKMAFDPENTLSPELSFAKGLVR